MPGTDLVASDRMPSAPFPDRKTMSRNRTLEDMRASSDEHSVVAAKNAFEGNTIDSSIVRQRARCNLAQERHALLTLLDRILEPDTCVYDALDEESNENRELFFSPFTFESLDDARMMLSKHLVASKREREQCAQKRVRFDDQSSSTTCA